MLFEIVDLEDLQIDVDSIKKQVLEYVKPRKEFYKTRNCNLYLESEFTEWWVEKATNGNHVGSGNKPIDVISTCGGIDVLAICLNKKTSNEKSIIQIFKGGGSDLDKMFKNKEYSDAVKLFRNTLQTKFNNCAEEYSIDNFYYIGFISTKTEIYCFGMKLQLKNITNIKENCFATSKLKSGIVLDGVINSEYGSAKIYKSKKRMEIRFYRNILDNPFVISIFKLPPQGEKQCDARPKV